MDNFDDITNDIRFTRRASPVPLGSRMSYRIAQICLILSLSCRSRESCSMKKLQTLSNALFQVSEFNKIIQFAKEQTLVQDFTPRMDPCVNSAIIFAVKYGLCKSVKNNSSYKLTALGRKYVNAIKNEDVLEREKAMLQKLGTDFTEELLNRI